MEIKKLISDQWEIMKNLRLEAFETDGKTFDSSLEETILETEQQWREKIEGESKIVLVAFEDGEPVGIVRAYWGISQRRKHIAYIRGLYVCKKYRGKGIAKKLLSSVIDEIKNVSAIKKISLEVITDLKDAVALYKSFGFEIVGTLRKELFINGKYWDKYVMELIVIDNLK